jgi:hypothetical protein
VAFLRARAWAFVALCMGCGVPLRPDGSPAEEQCPAGAKEAMASFGLHPGFSSIVVWIDANRQEDGPLIVYDGPVESAAWGPEAELPGGVRLLGRVWTGGPRVVIRYYSARLPDGKVIPFCAVAAEDGHGLPKTPGRSGSAALAYTHAAAIITGVFR